MASIKNTIITQTDGAGKLRVPAGTTAQRPAFPYVSISTGSTLTKPVDGLQLYATNATTTWATYQNLPSYLTGSGCITNTIVNESDTSTFTLHNISGTIRVYMLRNPTWNAVDTTGWTLNSTGNNYFSVDSNISVYYKDFSAGTYTMDTNSAMYIWDFNVDLDLYRGAFRFNTTSSQLEVWTGSIWLTVG